MKRVTNILMLIIFFLFQTAFGKFNALHIKASLISEVNSIEPKKPFWIRIGNGISVYTSFSKPKNVKICT